MTDPRRRGRPPKPGGPKVALNLRIPADIKDAAMTTAERRGESLADVVEAALRRYVRRHRQANDG